ncbi:hypothetical protein AO703_00455 [[Enterobacter] lignolyticus]|uniref:Uncharacterized protein n=1 Tax=[Enterobacter] lignolyticus TaxID=1334193 RepID=A0A806X179_9ENTR|nr:hypothetical protein AO703_00455 [[Enterobacter] lignolyticus]
MPLDLPRHQVSGDDVKIPEVSDLLTEPARFIAEALHFPASQHRAKNGKNAAQAAQADAQLVRSFGIVALEHNGNIRGDLGEAFTQHVACRPLCALVCAERDVFCIAGR